MSDPKLVRISHSKLFHFYFPIKSEANQYFYANKWAPRIERNIFLGRFILRFISKHFSFFFLAKYHA